MVVVSAVGAGGGVVCGSRDGASESWSAGVVVRGG